MQTQLNSAWLSSTQLDSAWLSSTQLNSAWLSSTQLDSAWFSLIQLDTAGLTLTQINTDWYHCITLFLNGVSSPREANYCSNPFDFFLKMDAKNEYMFEFFFVIEKKVEVFWGNETNILRDRNDSLAKGGKYIANVFYMWQNFSFQRGVMIFVEFFLYFSFLIHIDFS